MKSVHDYVHAMKAQGLEVLTNAGTPTESGPATGALVVDTTNGKLYINTGTAASATWSLIESLGSSIGTSELEDEAVTAAKIASAVAGNGLSGGAGSALAVGVDGSTIEITADTLNVKDAGITTAKLANNAVNASRVANSDGTGALSVRKQLQAVYDFSVDGGSQGTIVLADSGTFPDNAVVQLDSVDVLTTFQSSGDTATIKVTLPTDGDMSTAIAISAAGDPWDAGAHLGTEYTPLPVKTTASRAVSVVIATQDVTAGKAVFNFSYWVSQ